MNIIPKTIHYCWVGSKPKPKMVTSCINSWKKTMPDFKIVEWNEGNFDIKSNLYVKQAYEAGRYAFVADYIRLHALYYYGGIYMDTDVETIKPIDDALLSYPSFAGFENSSNVAVGTLGSVKGQKIIKDCLDYYKDRAFLKSDGNCDLTTIVKILTRILAKNGLLKNNTEQEIAGMHLFPSDYFYPKSYIDNKTHITSNTYSIHYYMDSWNTPSEKMKIRFHKILTDILKQILGPEYYIKLKTSLHYGETNEI